MTETEKDTSEPFFKFFPWEQGETPYWINPENGILWYVDKETTRCCNRETLHNLPTLDAVVFYVCENKDGKINPLDRILIDKVTNEVLHVDTSLEGMACKIDFLRLEKSM